jgi:hypothetical protein
VQALASVDDHVSVDDAPGTMLVGDAESDTVATDDALPPLAGESLPPPPHAASRKAEQTATACSAFMTLHATTHLHGD